MADRKTPARWDTSYEWKAVTLLGLGFGLVGLDRWIIAPLFPFMLGDLGLDLADQGNIIGVLGLAWGSFAIFSGRLADAIGHRRILVPSIILFSLASGFSGMATGFASLLAVRLFMGIMEGSVLPNAASLPRPRPHSRTGAGSCRGFNRAASRCSGWRSARSSPRSF